MDKFSISQVAQFSGVKPHNIRMWEQRYDVLNPQRSKGNTRYYSGDQLRRLLNIVSLMETDYKISELCHMTDEKLFHLIKRIKTEKIVSDTKNYFISQLIAAGMSYDEPYFKKMFAHCLLQYGMKNTYTKVVYPMLVRLGLMWTTNELPPAHEHFISNLVRQKVDTVIDSLPAPEPESQKWLLFLPENEFHDLGLLFSSYLIRQAGNRVTYLGANIPLQSLTEPVEHTEPENMLFFLVHCNFPKSISTFFSELNKNFPRQEIFAAASPELKEQINSDAKIKWLHSTDELERQL